VVGSCEHGNEPAGSVRGEEFLLRMMLPSEEIFCSM